MPGDTTADLIAALREGDETEIEEEAPTVPALPEDGGIKQPPMLFKPTSAPVLPAVIARVLDSPHKDELLRIADFLDPSQQKQLTVVFHTECGDVCCTVSWCNNKPENLMDSSGLLLLKVATSDTSFRPKPGATLAISFKEHPYRMTVTSLAPPQQLYPGIDLLCFLPQTAGMEKTGKLQESAPSVVSGEPSNSQDNGEPVVEGEKAASIKEFRPTEESFDEARP